MSLESAHLQRSTSPGSSGRSSPVSLKGKLGLDDGTTKKDKYFRRYASAIERALSLFDTNLQEWADYISFLSRLLKALQFRPNGVAEVPHKRLVAKRLAQCLNPSLPSGVHQKAIEIYTYIFALLGKDGLGRDLPLYLPGISSTLTYASLSIKPALLLLFEVYVLALDGSILRPALKAIILALLPGLEDETSEEFERVYALVYRLKDKVGNARTPGARDGDGSSEQYFWQCLFLASITSASRRQGALAYLSRDLPKTGGSRHFRPDESDGRPREEDTASGQRFGAAIDTVITPEPGLLIRCFESGLRDEQLLIQRGFLDLLVTHLPLHSQVISKASSEDVERLVAAAVGVVSRRDMSLNRRLWTWLLGPEVSGPHHGTSSSPELPIPSSRTKNFNRRISCQSEYFRHFAVAPLIRSTLNMISIQALAPSIRARPFRICLSLMDRCEIGETVVPQIFLPLMESVWNYQESAPSQDSFEEVLRSGRVFFDGVESGLIWSEMFKVLECDLHEDVSSCGAQNRIGLVLFLITKFNVREEDMQMVHMPLIILVLVIYLGRHIQQTACRRTEEPTDVYITALRIAVLLQDQIPERAFAAESSSERSGALGVDGDLVQINQGYIDRICQFYKNSRGNLELFDPFSGLVSIGQALFQNTSQLVLQILQMNSGSKYIELALSLFDKLKQKVPSLEKLDADRIVHVLYETSKRLGNTEETHSSVATIAAMVSVLETVSTTFALLSWLGNQTLRRLVTALISQIWGALSPSRPNFNVEAARCIWRLHIVLSGDKLVESSIATLLCSTGGNACNESQIEQARRFAVLWAHSTNSASALQGLKGITPRRRSQKLEIRIEKREQAVVLLRRPLLLLLDTLLGAKSDVSTFVTSWLRSLPNLTEIIDLLLNRVMATDYMEARFVRFSSTTKDSSIRIFPDIEECLYSLRMIARIISCSPENAWATLSNTSADFLTKNEYDATATSTVEGVSSDNAISQNYLLARICLNILEERCEIEESATDQLLALQLVATDILQQMLIGRVPALMAQPSVEEIFIRALVQSIQLSNPSLQIALMKLVTSLLRTSLSNHDPLSISSRKHLVSSDTLSGLPRSSFSPETNERDNWIAKRIAQPSSMLFDCLLLGLSSPKAYPVLDQWVDFLDSCIQMYAGAIFRILIPLADCLNQALRSVFFSLKTSFQHSSGTTTFQEPLYSIISLLNGLELVLAKAHERLTQQETGTMPIKSPEPSQGFFGNMVSGVFPSEVPRSRSISGNDRLTVLLCFKDAVLVCLEIWTWSDYEPNIHPRDLGTSASMNFTSMRLKNRTRRILEHLFAAETLECLETLIALWQRPDQRTTVLQSNAIMNVLHVLDESKPKNTMPAIFNAIYSRTNPNALDPSRKSSMASDLSDVSLAGFLVAYIQSLEDDAMNEVWSDTMIFLRDVLANPLPHRQTVPRLLEFAAILGHKVDNTNIGEQRKMRRELGDLFARLLAANFTVKPLNFSAENVQSVPEGKRNDETSINTNAQTTSEVEDVVSTLAGIIPNVVKTLVDSDRIAAACTTISTQVLLPTFRSKLFPQNVTLNTLQLLNGLSKIPEASKIWRKDLAEAFNDAKFFSPNSLALADQGWLPVLGQWVFADKDRIPEILSRISSPATAGIVFGVGATSARSEADRKTQLNLRRLALLLLAASDDSFVVSLNLFQEKLSELLTATVSSSPSSVTRGEVYMLLRALILKTSPMHLAGFWPMVNAELYEALYSLFPSEQYKSSNIHCNLQACKLLDTLLVLAPDEFQLREWLFITDTIDAVYRPQGWAPMALIDNLVEELDSGSGLGHTVPTPVSSNLAQNGKRRPLLNRETLQGIPVKETLDRVLRPFFRQLSINAFESTYSMEQPDWKACHDELLHDLFDDSTIA